MKPTYYILFILLLSFSFGNAQSSTELTEDNNMEVVNEVSNTVEEATIILELSIIKEAVARSSSDIRIYLNKERKVENIKLLFPQINKARKA